ncbi:MAG: hypothetical protein ABWW65_01280 [Thermoprotei archaeon]
MSSEKEKITGEREEETREERASEVEEIRAAKEVIESIGTLIDRVKDAVRDILSTALTSLDGKKLGEEIASMYKQLKEAGMPEELVNDIVKDYYNRKLSLIPSIDELLRSIAREIASSKVRLEVEKEKKRKEEE